MNPRHKGAAIVLVGGLGTVVLCSGTAYAYWSSTGTGTASASATTAQAVSASPVTVAAGLYPGATGSAAIAGTVTISNPNPFPVKITAVVFNAPTASNLAAGKACGTTGVTIAAKTAPSITAPLTVPAKSNGTNGAATLDVVASMDTTSEDGCQGATFTSTLNLTGQS